MADQKSERFEIISRDERVRRDPGGRNRVTLIGDMVLFPIIGVPDEAIVAGSEGPSPEALGNTGDGLMEIVQEAKEGGL